MANFEENLNFIYNYCDNNYKTIHIKNKEQLAFLNPLKTKILEIQKIVSEINAIHGKQLILKATRDLKNIEKLLSTFEKKIISEQSSVLWIYKKAKELHNLQNTSTNTKKSEILFDKLSYKISQIKLICEILLFAQTQVKKIEINNNKLEIPLDQLSKIIKTILNKTEEYNIGQLKRAQQKFKKSKELNDFMYGKKNPKLAHLLSLDSAVPVDTEKPLELKTPFGSVWVKKGGKSDRMIYNDQSATKAPNYDEMCEKLDSIIENVHQAETDYKISNVISLIEPIIKYINQPLTTEQNSILISGDTSPAGLNIRSNFQINERILSTEQKKFAAFLCGVLLLSESHEFRNPTGGKFERKAMKNVLRLAKNNCLNPFAVVFNRAKGRYIPAHDERSLKKVTRGSKKATTGGVKQTIRVLDEHNIPMEALTESNSDVAKYWAGKIHSYLSTKKLLNKLKKPISDTNQTPSQTGVVPDDIIKNLNDEGLPVPIYLTQDYYNNVKENLKPTITQDIIDDLRKLVKFSKMKNYNTINIDDIPEVIRSDIKTEINRNKKLINKLMNNSLH